MTYKEATDFLDRMIATIEMEHDSPLEEYYEAVSMAKDALIYKHKCETDNSILWKAIRENRYLD